MYKVRMVGITLYFSPTYPRQSTTLVEFVPSSIPSHILDHYTGYQQSSGMKKQARCLLTSKEDGSV